jgi:hypothetical protein
VVQLQSDHVVVLTEVYDVSPTFPLEIYNFGNWTVGDGLTWPSQGFSGEGKHFRDVMFGPLA